MSQVAKHVCMYVCVYVCILMLIDLYVCNISEVSENLGFCQATVSEFQLQRFLSTRFKHTYIHPNKNNKTIFIVGSKP